MSEHHEILAGVVGSASRDVAPDGRTTPGGVVHHAGLALARLGARTRVLTRVRGEDAHELLAALERAGVRVTALESANTTVCANDYEGEVDRHELLSVSDTLSAQDVPRVGGWRELALVQLGPLHRDDLAPGIARPFTGLVGLDTQGLLRERGPEGTRLRPLADVGKWFDGVAIAKASEVELPVLLDGQVPSRFLAATGVRELVVTRGPRGASVITAAGQIDVPALSAKRRHPVGAGDVFLAAYLFARVRGLPAEAAAGLASRASAAKIETGQVARELGTGDGSGVSDGVGDGSGVSDGVGDGDGIRAGGGDDGDRMSGLRES